MKSRSKRRSAATTTSEIASVIAAPHATTRRCPSAASPSQIRATEFECALGTMTFRPPSSTGWVNATRRIRAPVTSVLPTPRSAAPEATCENSSSSVAQSRNSSVRPAGTAATCSSTAAYPSHRPEASCIANGGSR